MDRRGRTDIDKCDTEDESESSDKIILNEAGLNVKKKERNFQNPEMQKNIGIHSNKYDQNQKLHVFGIIRINHLIYHGK